MRNYLGETPEKFVEILRLAGGSLEMSLFDEHGRRLRGMTARVVEPTRPGQAADIRITCDKPGCPCGQNDRYHTSPSHVRGREAGAGSVTYKQIQVADGTTLADLIDHVVPEDQLKLALREAFRALGKPMIAKDADGHIMRLRETRPQSLDEARRNAEQLLAA